MAIAHGACTGVPKGLSRHTRQSPISSRKRSTTSGPIVRHHAGRLHLLGQVEHHVGRRPGVEAVVGAQPLLGLGRRQLPDLPEEGAERPAELQRAPRPVTVPERHLARLPRRRRHDDALEADVLDPPGRRAEQERLAGPALVDHLLVQLAHPGAVGQEDAEEAAVGDGAAARDGQAPRAVPGPQLPADPVPHDPRAQLAELLAGVPAGQQIEHVDQQVLGQVGEAGAPAHQRGQVVHRGRPDREVGHDLLGQHVERVAQVAGGLDEPVLHAPRDDRGLDQVTPVLGEDVPAARLAHLVAGAADALQAAAHGPRRLHLDHEVDRAHVDARAPGWRWPPARAARPASAGPR